MYLQIFSGRTFSLTLFWGFHLFKQQQRDLVVLKDECVSGSVFAGCAGVCVYSVYLVTIY